MATKPRTFKRVLNACNKIRIEAGLKPRTKMLKGDLKNGESCPVKNTCAPALKFACASYLEGSKGRVWNVPNALKDFIRAFDAGLYPELQR